MSYSAELYAVPSAQAGQLAPIFEVLARKSNGRVSIESMTRDIGRGALTVWAVWDGGTVLAWVLTSIYEAPTGLKVFRIEGIVGRQRKRWLHLMSELLKSAQLSGCELVECTARDGWRDEIPTLKRVGQLLEARI